MGYLLPSRKARLVNRWFEQAAHPVRKSPPFDLLRAGSFDFPQGRLPAKEAGMGHPPGGYFRNVGVRGGRHADLLD